MITLEKYKAGGQTKHTCPSCGRRKCFVRYIDTETNEYIGEDCGKCDHDNSCGYHYKPREFYRDHGQYRKPWTYSSEVHHVRHPAQQNTLSIGIIDDKYGQMYRSDKSVFAEWMKTIIGEHRARLLCEEYQLGATADGRVVFWQRDIDNRLRTGKIMAYSSDGHRQGLPSWIHDYLKKNGNLPEEWNLAQCFFGEHLLSRFPDKAVYLVESEKTAVVCAGLFPQYVWIATGGCGLLNTAKAKVLRGRRVIVIPDSGELTKWLAVMSQTKDIDYSFVRKLEAFPPNTDILDWILSPVVAPGEG